MRWWRLHVENGQALASYSGDGVTGWTVFAQRALANPGSELISVLAGLTIPNTPSVGLVARFGRLLVCE
jgi:hypothetical protein